MAQQTQYDSLKVADAELFGALDRIRNSLSPKGTGNLTVSLGHGTAAVSGTFEEVRNNAAIQEVLNAGGNVFYQVIAQLGGNTSIQVIRHEPVDKVTITYPDNFEALKAAPLLSAVRRFLPPFGHASNIEKTLGPELAEFYRRREQGLLKLEEFTQSLIERTEAYRRTVDEEHAVFRRQAEEKAAADAERLRSEYEAKTTHLKEREDALDARAKALDDRSSRHARRQIRQDLKEILANRTKEFSLTKQTAAKRNIVHVMYGALITVPLVVFVRALYELVGRGLPPDWVLLARIAVGGIGLAAALVYYIRWNDQWFRQHATEEFRLRRLDLDIDRASWVVETAFEWKEEKGTEIPLELVDKLTRNLFVTEESDHRGVKHPGEDLASALLGASSRLNIQIPGLGDATLDRRGIREVKKKAEGE